MNYDKFLELVQIVCQRSESEVSRNSDFIIEELPIAKDGIRYVSEYVQQHKSEIEMLLN